MNPLQKVYFLVSMFLFCYLCYRLGVSLSHG